jgi:hypothetical protein
MKSDRLYVAFGDLMYISDKMNEASAQYTAALTYGFHGLIQPKARLTSLFLSV